MAHQTLRLRAAHRWLRANPWTSGRTWNEWDLHLEEASWNTVFEELKNSEDPHIQKACEVAEQEALHLELGPTRRQAVSAAIRQRLKPFMNGSALPRNSVLIGGPPCQAYSIVGRSRNKGIVGYKAAADHRHFLYKEYLHVIAEFEPAVFVMENVKGILTSRVEEDLIFQSILADLERPARALGRSEGAEYVLVPLPRSDKDQLFPEPSEFIVRAEEHGVPQARHRVIILGVRRDVYDKCRSVRRLADTAPPSVWEVINDLPALRPELSFRGKGLTWLDALNAPLFDQALAELGAQGDKSSSKVAEKLAQIRSKLIHRRLDPGSGQDRLRLTGESAERLPKKLATWFKDRKTTLLANHESRSHMPSDLVRYMFAAAFGQVCETSPRLMDFPPCLLPSHRNVDRDKIHDSIFKDRFRVQVGSRHSMTVTSHIAKDGHAFIHPKAVQCRSLTVREAARLQTFPDSYVFLGNRTSQYTQVGNAVPPYLAKQIADIAADVLRQARLI